LLTNLLAATRYLIYLLSPNWRAFLLGTLLVASPVTRWLLPAFVIAGLREIGDLACTVVIVDLAPETHRGRAIGLYYLIRGLSVVRAPLVGGLLWGLSLRLPFLGGFTVMAVGTLSPSSARGRRRPGCSGRGAWT